MSEKKRTTVSLHEGIIEKAAQLMADEHFNDFSSFLEQLVREKWAERELRLRDESRGAQPPAAGAAAAPGAVKYPKAKRPARGRN
jgi:hypothetical protein